MLMYVYVAGLTRKRLVRGKLNAGMLARTNLPLDDIRYDVTITHIERPDCLYIQRVPPTDKDPGFSDDPDPTLEAAAEELQTLEEIMAKINEPDYFKKYTPLTTASDGKWALCPK